MVCNYLLALMEADASPAALSIFEPLGHVHLFTVQSYS